MQLPSAYFSNNCLFLLSKSMTPCWGITFLLCSSQKLPSLWLGPLKGLFELTWRPLRTLNLPQRRLSYRTAEKQGHCQVFDVRRGGHREHGQGTIDTNLDCAIVFKRSCFCCSKKLGGAWAPCASPPHWVGDHTLPATLTWLMRSRPLPASSLRSAPPATPLPPSPWHPPCHPLSWRRYGGS